jgi:hypothetical protein
MSKQLDNGKIRGNTGKYGEIRGNTGKYGRLWEDREGGEKKVSPRTKKKRAVFGRRAGT